MAASDTLCSSCAEPLLLFPHERLRANFNLGDGSFSAYNGSVRMSRRRMPCCSLKRICLDIVSFVRRAQNHTYRAERETSDEQRSCQFVVGSVLVMVLKLFFTVVSVVSSLQC